MPPRLKATNHVISRRMLKLAVGLQIELIKNKLYWTVIFKLITAIASSLPTSPFTEHNLVDLARRGQQKQISEQKIDIVRVNNA